MNDSERDTLLIRLDERTLQMKVTLAAHLAHHWSVTVLAVGAILTAIVSLVANFCL